MKRKWIVILIGGTVLGGCNVSEWIKQGVSPSSPEPVVSASPSAAPNGSVSVNAAKAKANAELLREMYVSVNGVPPTNRADFGSMLDSMNQGASLEGVYNGFIHSAAYRKLEVENPGAQPDALKFFVDELAQIEMELPSVTEFNGDSAKPIELIDPASENTPSVESFSFPAKKPSAAAAKQPEGITKDALVLKYSKLFNKSSIFTLKRVLGDEALKLIQTKKDNKEQLAGWYGKWALKLAAINIDFGIQQRNIADEQFHSKWAMAATEDQIRWEVLNRLHRVLIALNGKKL